MGVALAVLTVVAAVAAFGAAGLIYWLFGLLAFLVLLYLGLWRLIPDPYYRAYLYALLHRVSKCPHCHLGVDPRASRCIHCGGTFTPWVDVILMRWNSER